jgi:hypothetical protein
MSTCPTMAEIELHAVDSGLNARPATLKTA